VIKQASEEMVKKELREGEYQTPRLTSHLPKVNGSVKRAHKTYTGGVL